jgi:hypothetical protein
LSNCAEASCSYDENENSQKTSHISSLHYVEEVLAADVSKENVNEEIQVPKKIATTDNDDDDGDDVGSECSSDNDETLHSEILKLCNQIENVNGVDRVEKKQQITSSSYDGSNSSDSLTHEERRHLNNIMSKVKEK